MKTRKIITGKLIRNNFLFLLVVLFSFTLQNSKAQCIANTWTGSVSTAWGNAANWSCSHVPLATDSVIIPNGATNWPVISDSGRVTNSLTIQSSAVLSINANNSSSLTVNGTFVLNGTISVGNTLTLCGQIIINSSFSATNLVLSGTTMQYLPTSSINHLIINNPAGVALNGTVNVTSSGSIILDTGKIYLGNYNLSPLSITGASSSKYFVTNGTGMLIQNVNYSTVLFPVGSASSYTPAIIYNSSGVPFSIRVNDSISNSYAAAPPYNFVTGSSITTNAVNKTWHIISTSSSANITLQWNAYDTLPGFNKSACYFSRFINGYGWFVTTTASTASGSNPYTLTSAISSFSNGQMGIGSGGALPVSLINFSGKKINNIIELNWQTASEINNDHFMIERSTDGNNFELVNTVKGSGTSNMVHDYSLMDDVSSFIKQKIYKEIFYRLNQVDMDGTINRGEIISVNIADNSTGIADIYPNPFNSSFTVSANSERNEIIKIEVKDLAGRLVSSQTENINSLNKTINVNMNDEKEGMYFVTVYSENSTVTKKIICNRQ